MAKAHHIEHHVVDRHRNSCGRDLGWPSEFHSPLQESEVGSPGLVEGDDFPVKDGISGHQLREDGQFRIAGCRVEPVAGVQRDAVVFNSRNGTDAIPFHFERPVFCSLVDVRG